MSMRCCKQEGKISKDKILRRFKALLNLAYLEARPLEGGGYRIPDKVFQQIQTELDFNLPDEKQKQKLEDQIKKRYRQRDSYRFWKEFLDIANINNRADAKEYLLKIYHKLDNKGVYGSMTHSMYAIETLELALDDTYNTSELILSQYSFANPKKPNKKRRATKKSKTSLNSNNAVPF